MAAATPEDRNRYVEFRRAASILVVVTGPAARQVGGGVLMCLGFAFLARFGFGSARLLGLDIGAFAIVIAGSGVSVYCKDIHKPNDEQDW